MFEIPILAAYRPARMSGEAQVPPIQYYVLTKGEMFGPFSKEELSAGLSAGRFDAGDFVQVEGQPDWQPIEQVLGAHGEKASRAVAPDWPCILRWAGWRLRYSLAEQSFVAGGVCLAAGALSLALSHWPFVFWIPWFLVAAGVGAVLLRRKHQVHGALLLVGVIGLPLLFHLFWPKAHAGRTEPVADNIPMEQPTAAPLPAAAPEPLPSVVPAPAPEPIVTAPPAPAAPPVAASTTEPIPGLSPSGATPPAAVSAEPIPGLAPGDTPPAPAESSSSKREAFATQAAEAADKVGSFFARLWKPKQPDATPAPSPSSEAFMREHRDAFVIIKGDTASGSGFACRVGNQTMLYTNIHIVADIKDAVVTRVDGIAMVPGAAQMASERDIARFALPDPPPHPLEVMTDVDANVRIGDEIAVLGNSGGGGVVTSLRGKVVGIGPDRVEISAEIIPGNSGSPIIHLETGKVIGIASYLTRRYQEFSSNPTATVVRRFGYRIDKMTDWENVNWPEFYQEADSMQKMTALTRDLVSFLQALRIGGDGQYSTDALRNLWGEYTSKLQTVRNPLDRQSATENFLNGLRFLTKGDVQAAQGRWRYSYFRKELSEEQQVRDRLYNAYSSLVANNPNSLNHAAHQ